MGMGSAREEGKGSGKWRRGGMVAGTAVCLVHLRKECQSKYSSMKYPRQPSPWHSSCTPVLS